MKVGYEPIMVEVPLGRGHVDVRAYLQALDSLDHDVTLLLEHLPTEAAYDAAAAHLRREAKAGWGGVIMPALRDADIQLPPTRAPRDDLAIVGEVMKRSSTPVSGSLHQPWRVVEALHWALLAKSCRCRGRRTRSISTCVRRRAA